MSELKTPPHSLEAEDAVLGSVLLSPDVLNNIDLKASDFYDRQNSMLWEEIHDMRSSGRAFDVITLAEKMKENNTLEKVGGYDRLTDLQKEVIVPHHSAQYSKTVKELSNYRSEIEILQDGLALAYKGKSASTGVLSALTSLATLKPKDKDMHIHAEDFVERCKAGEVGHLPWWCDEWTNKMGRLSSELVIVHAPRSTGKTAIMLQWMREIHEKGGNAPLVSIEMLKKTLAPRFIASIGQVSTFTMKSRGSVTLEEERKSKSAIDQIRALNFRIREDEASIDEIFQYAISENQRKRVDCIWVDNLLCINDGGKQYQSKTVMYDAFIKKFRELRNILSVPVFILAHPNADGNIAWSKDVENIADIILYLEQVQDEGVVLKGSGKFIPQDTFMNGKHILAKFQKCRDGIQPIASLEFDGSRQTFIHSKWEQDQ